MGRAARGCGPPAPLLLALPRTCIRHCHVQALEHRSRVHGQQCKHHQEACRWEHVECGWRRRTGQCRGDGAMPCRPRSTPPPPGCRNLHPPGLASSRTCTHNPHPQTACTGVTAASTAAPSVTRPAHSPAPGSQPSLEKALACNHSPQPSCSVSSALVVCRGMAGSPLRLGCSTMCWWAGGLQPLPATGAPPYHCHACMWQVPAAAACHLHP